MVEFVVFLALMKVAHFAGDFPFQTDEMATRKSTSKTVLLSHVAVYTLCLLLFTTLAALMGLVSSQYLIFWVLLNGVLHFITDYATSKVTSRMHAQGRTHDFFGMIGLDQLIHDSTILLTAYWLFRLGGPILGA